LILLERRQVVVKSSPRFKRALLLMVMACFVRSLSDLSLKYGLTDLNGWDGFFWPRLGIFAVALPDYFRRLFILICLLMMPINRSERRDNYNE
jgi:hypothetical protein